MLLGENPLGVCQGKREQNCPLVYTAVGQMLKAGVL